MAATITTLCFKNELLVIVLVSQATMIETEDQFSFYVRPKLRTYFYWNRGNK